MPSAKLLTITPNLDKHTELLRLNNFNELDSPGLAVVISRDNKIIKEEYYGMANLETNEPINDQTIFHVASLSKPVTALAILILRDQGSINLDDLIKNYIPELQIKEDITIRHLLSHTSGIKDQWQLLDLSGKQDQQITTDDCLSILFKQKHVQFTPGSNYMYSNSGYTLLAEVIERVSKMPFNEFLIKNIFLPLDMLNTQVNNNPSLSIPNQSRAYRLVDFDDDVNPSDLTKAGFLDWSPNLFVNGATCLTTNMNDYKKWMLVHNPKSEWYKYIKEMSAPYVLNNGKKSFYGLGYLSTDQNTINYLIFHTGQDYSFDAYFAYQPNANTCIAIFSNSSLGYLDDLAADMVYTLNGYNLFAAEKFLKNEEVNHRKTQKMCGLYESNIGEIQQIYIKNNRLFSTWKSGRRELLYKEDNKWSHEGREDYIFSRNKLVTKTIVSYNEWTKIKIKNIRPAPNLVGEYYSEEVNNLVNIFSDNNRFFIKIPGMPPKRLRQVSNDLFLFEDYWIRVREDNLIYLSSPRCLNVIYKRNNK